MATLTKTAKKKPGRKPTAKSGAKRGPKPGPKPAAKAPAGGARRGPKPKPKFAAGPVQEIPLASIAESPTNARRDFDPEKLAGLAASLKRHGLLQAVIVRADGDRYELVAGARRYRAAKLAGLKAIPCRVIDVTDEEAAEQQFDENFFRQDLNPIEEAQAMQQLLADGRYTQTSLGKRLGISQSQIANRLRLLKLPLTWRAKVETGELPPTHARELLAYADLPAIMTEMEKALKDEQDDEGSMPSLHVFQDLVESTVWSESRAMEAGYSGPTFKVTPEVEAELDVREVEQYGRKMRRAFNAELWDRLQAEADTKAGAKQAKKAAKTEAAAKDPALSPAERKAKQKAAADLFNKRLYRWRTQWLQQRVADACLTADRVLVERMLLQFAVLQGHYERHHELLQACKTRDLDPRNGDPLEIARAALSLWWLHDVTNFHSDIRAEHVDQAVDMLGVDIEIAWRLSEEFLELHNKDQLIALAGELAWERDRDWLTELPKRKRPEIIAEMLKSCDLTRCPAEVLKVKPVRL